MKKASKIATIDGGKGLVIDIHPEDLQLSRSKEESIKRSFSNYEVNTTKAI
jgi:hypothetical protein